LSSDSIKPSCIFATSSPGNKINPLPALHPENYTLIRLTISQNEKTKNIPHLLDAQLALHAPNVEELGDESWEICVLESSITTVQGTLGKILPESDVDICYDPFEPTADDLESWDYGRARSLRRIWFEKRADRIARVGWAPAADHYAHRLEAMHASDYQR